MRKFIYGFLFGLFAMGLNAQELVYHPDADAKADIAQVIKQAQDENKNIILQVGGNWCSWCILFNKYIHEDQQIADLIDDNYVYYHLNYSKENKNEDLLEKYGNPEENGFPVLLVLDSSGELIHTQETGSLEEGKGYNHDKVYAFFEEWIPADQKEGKDY